MEGRLTFVKREFYSERTALAQCALRLDISVVSFNNSFYITQPESKPFYIVDVSCMGTVKFLKNSFYRFATHTNTIVFDPDDEFFLHWMKWKV